MTEQQPEGFLLRLLGGHCGLAVTFWAFGLGVGIAQALLVGPVVRDSEGWPVFTTVGVSVVFHILVWVAIWKAANRYEGRPAWSVLAKIAVALWIVSAVAAVSLALVAPGRLGGGG